MERYIFNQNQKNFLITLIVLGVVCLVLGFSILPHERVWANVLLNTFYFLAVSLAGTFFLSVHIIGQSGWHVSIQRIPEAVGSYVPYSAIFMLLILVFGLHDIYHWSHEHLDPILQAKKPYLNTLFFTLRLIVYFAGWTFFTYKLRQASLQSDLSSDYPYMKKSQLWAVLFIVFFAISNSTSSWDILMSIDAHWYSTLYAWYIFASLFVSGIAVIILILVFLRSKGYMKHTNDEHLHDLGKYLFGISIFWMYLWFSQYMLIWYSNIPEETTYFIQRVDNFSTLFYLNIGINFFIPFLALLPRKAPRKSMILAITSVIVLIGHWIDFYLVVMPGALGEKAGIGFLEIGLSIGFTGLFLFIVFRSLTKASLIPKNHPYHKESLDYHNL